MTSHLIEEETPGAQLLVGGPPSLDGTWILIEDYPVLHVQDHTTGIVHDYRKEWITHTVIPVPYIYVHDSMQRSEGIALLKRGYMQPPAKADTDVAPPPNDMLQLAQDMARAAERELLLAKCHHEEQMRSVGRLLRFDRVARGISADALAKALHITPDHVRDLDLGARMWTTPLLRDYNTMVRDERTKIT